MTQKEALDILKMGHSVFLTGAAGTGKTFISIYLALNDILNLKLYHKLIIVRSVVPSRDMGFLPGNVKEKARVYEEPYMNICNDLFGRGDAYDILKHKNIVEFTTTSHLRGITMDNSIVLVDEMQNLVFSELNTVVTRIGENCKILFCGDFRQTDLLKDKERSGLFTFKNILGRIDGFDSIEFDVDDIVRSKLVKDYIIAKLDEGII
jgi:phosphate starvation-inducible protein PhoH